MLMDRTASSSKVVISSQVTVAVREELERRALEADRTLSAEVRRAISEHLERSLPEHRTAAG